MFDDDGNARVALYDVNGNALLVKDDAAFTPGTSPVLPIGALADEAAPDSVDEGDVGVPRMTLSRILWTGMRAKGSASADTEVTVGSAGGDGGGEGASPLSVWGANRLFDGTNWNRARGNAAETLLASAARTETVATGDLVNYNARGVMIFVKVAALSDTPSVTLQIQVKDPDGAGYVTIKSCTAITDATGTPPCTYGFLFYPGITAQGLAGLFESFDLGLPARAWRVQFTHGDSDAITYQASAIYLL